MTPPRCLTRSPLTTAELHVEYVTNLTDAERRGLPDVPVSIGPPAYAQQLDRIVDLERAVTIAAAATFHGPTPNDWGES